jgi:hypothetical protein
MNATRLGLFTLVLLIVIAGLCWPVYPQTHRRFTFVLVHGAFGGRCGFRPLDALHTADGQKVYRPTRTGQSERNHLTKADVTLNTHVQVHLVSLNG